MKFHLRRVDREINDPKALRRILLHSKHFILSLADGGEPYAVPMGYVYDEEENAVYFHCAKEGKKIEFLNMNPQVWGLVVIDEGVQSGGCVNLYASAMFLGKVVWVSDAAEKTRAMNLFAERLSSDVEGTKQRLKKMFEAGEALPAGVVIAKIRIEELTGKRSTEMTIEKLLELTA
jgi:uncharacterized protein